MRNHSPNKARALNLEEFPSADSWRKGRVPVCRPAALRKTNSIYLLVGLRLYPSRIWLVVILGQWSRNFSGLRCFIGCGPCLLTKGPCLSTEGPCLSHPSTKMCKWPQSPHGLTPKLRLLVLTLSFQPLRSVGLYRGGCTCHKCVILYSKSKGWR